MARGSSCSSCVLTSIPTRLTVVPAYVPSPNRSISSSTRKNQGARFATQQPEHTLVYVCTMEHGVYTCTQYCTCTTLVHMYMTTCNMYMYMYMYMYMLLLP